MFGIFSVLTSLFVALAYPLYITINVLEAPTTSAVEQWMSYWMLFAVLSTLEWFFGLSLFPLYYELKTLFILWLTLPKTKGAWIIYTKYVRPKLRKTRVATGNSSMKVSAGNPARDREVLQSATTFLQEHNPTTYEKAFAQAEQRAARMNLK